MQDQDPFIKITIGNDDFQTGGLLINCSLTIGEGKKQNNTIFTIYDENGYYADKYISASYLTGGIELPNDFYIVDEPSDRQVSANSSEIDSGGNGTVSKGGKFTPEVRAFLDTIAWKETASGEALSIQGYYAVNGGGFFSESEARNGFPPSAGFAKNVGRYQFALIDYNHAKQKYPQINNYSPQNQDLIAYFKLEYRGSLAPLLAGDITTALNKAAKEWAAIPTSTNPRGEYGQVSPDVTFQQFKDYYNTRLQFYKSQSSTPESSPQLPKSDSGAKTNTPTDNRVKRVLNTSTNVSFYGINDGFAGKRTANGEIFNPEEMTAAHNELPFNSLVRVTWLANNRSVVVRINDRGGFVKLGRQLDISYGAAKQLSSPGNDAIATGILNCRLELLESGSDIVSQGREKALDAVKRGLDTLKNSTPLISVPEVSAKGTQITVEMSVDRSAIAVFSFIHTGTRHDQFTGITEFTGQSVSWLLNRRIKNTRFTGVTLKGLASNIVRRHNLELSMDEEGDYIDAVSQVGLTDWQFLERVANKQGFIMRTVGRVVQIAKNTVLGAFKGYTLIVGDNLKSLVVVDRAQTDAVGSDNKIEHYSGKVTTSIDPDSGGIAKNGQDNKRDAGKQPQTFTTGSDIPQNRLNRVYENPRPETASIKEYQLDLELYTLQSDLENLTPDTQLFISGSLPFIINKSWFIESVSHAYDNGTISTSLRCYVPVAPKDIKNDGGKAASTTSSDSEIPQNGVGNIGAYTIRDSRGQPIIGFNSLREHWLGTGAYTGYRPAPENTKTGRISFLKRNPNQLVYDFILSKNGSIRVGVPSPIAGVVGRVGGSNGIVEIRNGVTSVRLLHLSGIKVTPGQSILRGHIVGIQDTVGPTSTGIHLHIEAPELVLRQYIESLLSGQF